MPLQPLMGARAFAKWGIDFVGPIDPSTYRTQAQYIIVDTDYLTKWVEAKAKRHNDARTTVQTSCTKKFLLVMVYQEIL